MSGCQKVRYATDPYDATPAEVIRQKAAAWAEGYLAGRDDTGRSTKSDNPYRTENQRHG